MIAFAIVLVIIGAVLLAIASPRQGGNLEIGTSDIKTNLPEITGPAKIPAFILGLVFIGVGLWMGVVLFVKSTEEPASVSSSQPGITSKPIANPAVPPTDTLIPLPTATIDADPTVYDNFKNSAFDGNIHPGLWSIDHRGNAGTAKIIQQEGTLLLSDTANSTSDGIVLKLRNWNKSVFKFFEIKVMLSSEGEGSKGNISINVESPDIPGGWTELGIGHHPSHNYASIGTKMNNEWAGGPDLQYNTWHKLRIEFNNQTKVFTYLVDDQLVDTRNLPASNEVSFKPVIQLWHEKGTSVKGFVDEVRIE